MRWVRSWSVLGIPVFLLKNPRYPGCFGSHFSLCESSQDVGPSSARLRRDCSLLPVFGTCWVCDCVHCGWRLALPNHRPDRRRPAGSLPLGARQNQAWGRRSSVASCPLQCIPLLLHLEAQHRGPRTGVQFDWQTCWESPASCPAPSSRESQSAAACRDVSTCRDRHGRHC